MRPVRLRWLLGALVGLAFVLAACSTPQTPQPARPDDSVVSIDGYQARIDTSKLDLQPLSFWNPPMTSACAHNVAYAQVIVPILGRDSTGAWVPYVDVFWMPRHWNHDLALYAHGYIAPSDPGFLDQLTSGSPSSQPLLQTRDLLLCEGYALGASSYSDQGYAVKEGIIDTHLMNAVFPFIFWRRPDKTYVFGSSMGGLVTVALAELFPHRYDGAMPTCGPLAGSLAEFSYIGNVRLSMDSAYPPALSGTLTDPAPDPGDWVTSVTNAIASSPSGLLRLANTGVTYVGGTSLPLLQTPATYAAQDALNPQPPSSVQTSVAVNALLHALRYHVIGAADAIARGGGSPFLAAMGFGSLDGSPYPSFVDPITYPPYPPVSPSDTSLAYYTMYYQPSGVLRVPTLSLHNLYDPDVPFAHETVYRALVAKNGPEGLAVLHTYSVEGPIPAELMAQTGYAGPTTGLTAYGHCNITPSDLVVGLNAVASGDYSGLGSTYPDFTEVTTP